MERGKSKQNANATSGLAVTENSNYNIRPPFKDKFRPAEAKAAIEKLIPDLVLTYSSP